MVEQGDVGRRTLEGSGSVWEWVCGRRTLEGSGLVWKWVCGRRALEKGRCQQVIIMNRQALAHMHIKHTCYSCWWSHGRWGVSRASGEGMREKRRCRDSSKRGVVCTHTLSQSDILQHIMLSSG